MLQTAERQVHNNPGLRHMSPGFVMFTESSAIQPITLAGGPQTGKEVVASASKVWVQGLGKAIC